MARPNLTNQEPWELRGANDARLAALMTRIASLENPPSCRVYHNTTQSLPHNSETVLTFNSFRWNVDSMYSAGSPTRITLSQAGVYFVAAHLEYDGAAADYTRVFSRLRVNGTDFIAIAQQKPTAGVVGAMRLQVATIWKFAAGQYVEATGFHTNSASAARNAQGSTGVVLYATEFMAIRLGAG